jgi:uncharacterized protein YbjT (DUF2867 family)
MQNILVTGATGNVGSRVVQELRERSVLVRAFVRDPGKAAAMLGEKVELAVGDFGDPGSIQAALDGVDGVFLACSNQPRQVEYEQRVIDVAEEMGVRRIIKLSALGAEIGSPVAFWDWHARIEVHLRACGVPFVILRPTFSMANLLASAGAVQYTRKLFMPVGDAKVSMYPPPRRRGRGIRCLDRRRTRGRDIHAHRSRGDHLRWGSRASFGSCRDRDRIPERPRRGGASGHGRTGTARVPCGVYRHGVRSSARWRPRTDHRYGASPDRP